VSSRISVTEPVGPQMGGIMVGLLDQAVKRLTSSTGNIHEAVHDARKNLKAFRSYLRLLRAIIGDDSFRRLNIQARDAARILSGARDTVALHDAIGHVEKYYRKSAQRPDIGALRRAADVEIRDTASEASIRTATRKVTAMLKPCRDEVRAWTLPDNPAPYVKGLAKTYGTAAKALGKGLATRLPDDMHEARKRIIHWRYQLDLFTGLWPRRLKAEVRELQDLREDLGQHNDLVLLETRIVAAEGGFAGLQDSEMYLDAITVLRADRARTAGFRGSLLFDETPAARAAELDRWWQAAFDRKAGKKR